MLADRLPAMWGSDTFTTVVSSTSMKVAHITETAISHGLMCRCSVIARSFQIDRRHGRHAGTQEMLGVLAGIEHDLHGDALNDLHEVAGRVLRRQQAEPRAGGGRD